MNNKPDEFFRLHNANLSARICNHAYKDDDDLAKPYLLCRFLQQKACNKISLHYILMFYNFLPDTNLWNKERIVVVMKWILVHGEKSVSGTLN